MKKILLNGIKTEYKTEISEQENFSKLENKFKKTGIAYFCRLNSSNDTHFQIDVDTSKVQNICMLPPYNNETKFTLYNNPKSELILFGMKKKDSLSFWYNLDIQTWKKKSAFDGDTTTNDNTCDLIKILEDNFSQIKIDDNFYDYISPSHMEAKKVLEFKHLDMNALTRDELVQQYPMYMNLVLQLPESEENNQTVLTWKKLTFNNGFYIGELSSESVRHGRGAYIFSDKTYIIGTFSNNVRNGYFEEYSEDNKLNFKGTYQNGKKHGYGVFTYDDGSNYKGDYKNDARTGKGEFTFASGARYIGDFMDNKREGKGIYYYDENEMWEGTFLNNKMHGTGNYTFASGDCCLMTFENGQQV